MRTSLSRASRVFTISFPEDLAKEVVAVAEEESRNISELFREAFRTYRLQRIQRRLAAARLAAAGRVDDMPGPDDVERIVDEIRGKHFRRKRAIA